METETKTGYRDLTRYKLKRAQRAISVLAQRHRLEILHLLLHHGPMTITDIADRIQTSQPEATQANGDLIRIGLVKQKRKGKFLKNYVLKKSYREYINTINYLRDIHTERPKV